MRRYFVLLATLLLPVCVSAQNTGLPPFNSFSKGQFDSINNQNLNVIFAIPIMSSPGRGLNLNFSAVNNSLIWVPSSNNAYWTISPNTTGNLGWQLNAPTGQASYTYHTVKRKCDQIGDFTYTTTYSGYKYVDALGTPHAFSLLWQYVENDCVPSYTYSGTYTSYATDGSGFYATVDQYDGTALTIYSPSGMQVSSTGMTDPNGNYFSSGVVSGSETDWGDSVGRTALKIITTGTPPTQIQYKVLDPTGSYQNDVVTVTMTAMNIKTNFGCSGIVEYTGTASLPTSIALPNGQTYTITYEQTPPGNTGYYTGRVAKVVLPTGGYYEYQYGTTNDGINCADGSTVNLTETVSDGTNSATWTYVRNTTNLTTTVTTPALPDTPNSNDTVYTFNSSGQLTSVKVYKESPGVNALRTVNTTWASNGSPATQVTILEDGSTQSKVATTYDSNGLLGSLSEYDWGPGAPGSLLRTTTYTYQTSSNYTNLNLIGLLTSKVVKDGNGTVQYRQDTTYDGVAIADCPSTVPGHLPGYGCSYTYRGNPTTVTTYLNPAGPSNGVYKDFTYDSMGNLLTAQLNCCQQKTWSYSATTEYSEPDSVTSGSSPTLTTSFTYNQYTGQVLTATDPNYLVTNYSYDYLRRPTRVWQTNGSTTGASVTYEYWDSTSTASSLATIDSSKSVQQIVALDGLGRPNLSTTEDASNNVYSKVSVLYDLLGRAYQTSNPYTGSSGSYYTTTAFDVLGRPTKVTAPDGSVTTYSYSAQFVTTADPAGIQRESKSDAAGRQSIVYEPDPSNGNTLTLQTSYTYNVLNELTQVTEGSQTRSFVYDALGRLTSSSIPEMLVNSVQHSTSLFYDQWDNMTSRTDGRGVVTTYSYDGLNRLAAVGYSVGSSGVTAPANVCKAPGASSNNASICFTYGTTPASYNNGLLVSMTDTLGSENYTYNSLEQLTQLQKLINGTTYTMGYSSNLTNELTGITYPSGRAVSMPVDAIGRLSSVSDANTTYASGLAYNAAGQLTGLGYGNGLCAGFGFTSDTLLLSSLSYFAPTTPGNCASGASQTRFGLSYSYPASPNNNGQITGITDNVDNGRTASYQFDALYRLTQAVTVGDTAYPKWGLAMTYDRYGNRTAQSVATTNPPSCVAPICPTNSVAVDSYNHITTSGYGYDANGNMTNDGVNTLTYDVENHVLTASGSLGSGSYTYDGNGLRVQKSVTGGNTTVYIFSGSKVIAEYDNGAAPASPSREYIYSGAALLAKIDSTGTKYYHQDHLSNRMVTDSSGNDIADIGTFPYGESWYNTAGDKLLFTTYERDAESGNDYAQARSYVNRLARFSSLDPLTGSTSDPQSLNRYSYVRNMPVMAVDPSGM